MKKCRICGIKGVVNYEQLINDKYFSFNATIKEVSMMMNYYTSIIIMVLLSLMVLSILISENNRMYKSKKRIFITTNVLIAMAAVVEYIGVLLSGHADIPHIIIAAVKAADYTLTPMTGGALIMLMQGHNKKSRLLIYMFIGNAILQIISAFNGWMVVIDNQNHYTHGRLYPIYMAFYLFVILILMIKMALYGKSFKKQNRSSLYATIFLVCVGIALQELSGWNCRVAYLAATFAVTFLYIHYSEFYQLRLDEKLTEQQIKLSNDPLTGVLSRFAYNDAINTYNNCPPDDMAVFLIYINGLKVVNDSLGHEAGDELICGAADCIEASIGRKGQTFRIGGDEFVVFAHMTRKHVESALLELERKTSEWSGKKVDKLSMSVGYALAKEFKASSIEELVKEADKGMYEQKQEYYRLSGRNRRKS